SPTRRFDGGRGEDFAVRRLPGLHGEAQGGRVVLRVEPVPRGSQEPIRIIRRTAVLPRDLDPLLCEGDCELGLQVVWRIFLLQKLVLRLVRGAGAAASLQSGEVPQGCVAGLLCLEDSLRAIRELE